jgi:hypothetical protein
MLNESTAIQNQIETQEAQECIGAEIDKLAMMTVVIAAGLVGAWTLARIGSALYMSGGPVELFKSWLGAVTGTGI